MSQGNRCRCAEAGKPLKQRAWVVTQRCSNFSAFNGYRYTPSDYSGVHCKSCNAYWRTKARYVASLRGG